MNDRQFVQKEVFLVIRDILCDNNVVIRESDQLSKDLKIVSDDLSFIFVPELEKRLGVKIPIKKWSHVGTVGEAIDLLVEAIRIKGSGSRDQST